MHFQVAKGSEYIGTRMGDFHGPVLEEDCARQSSKTLNDPPSCVVPSSLSVGQPVPMKRCHSQNCYFLWQKGESWSYSNHMSTLKAEYFLGW